MKILMKRAQSPGRFFRVSFKLWAKLELEKDEQAIIDRYDFDQSVLIFIYQEYRFTKAFACGFVASVVLFFIGGDIFGRDWGLLIALLSLVGITWFLMDYWRETVYVKDLLHGRNFRCASIERLVSKEYFLKHACGYLRQVMETAKHWGGTQSDDIPALDPEMAKQFLIKRL